MALEIERKFLPIDESWRDQVERSVAMHQAYLGGDGVSVRIRIAGDTALINIKQNRLGLAREEFEYPVPMADGLRMMELAGGGSVSKTRHYLRYGGLLWEIDEFSGANAGLIVAEVELESEHQSIERPDWVGREVTDEVRYYNVALAQYPFNSWNDES